MRGAINTVPVIIYWKAEKGLQGRIYTYSGVEVPGLVNFSGPAALVTWAREQGLHLVPVGREVNWGCA